MLCHFDVIAKAWKQKQLYTTIVNRQIVVILVSFCGVKTDTCSLKLHLHCVIQYLDVWVWCVWTQQQYCAKGSPESLFSHTSFTRRQCYITLFSLHSCLSCLYYWRCHWRGCRPCNEPVRTRSGYVFGLSWDVSWRLYLYAQRTTCNLAASKQADDSCWVMQLTK